MSMMIEEVRALAVQVEWITDFIVIDAGRSVLEARVRLSRGPEWIILSRNGGQHLYALRAHELDIWLYQSAVGSKSDPLEKVLQLSEEHASTRTPDRASLPQIDRSWRPNAQAPSIERWVQVDAGGTPMAVGVPLRDYIKFREDQFRDDIASAELSIDFEEIPDSGASPDQPAAGPAPPPSEPTQVPSPRKLRGARSARPRIELPAEAARPPVDSDDAPDVDEGTRPVRFPSLEADRPFVAGETVTITVDLLRQISKETQGGAIDPGTLPEDWQTLELKVLLSSAAIDFDDEPQPLTIVRNAASKPATFAGTVKAGLASGEPIDVTAAFFHGARFCGSALRRFFLGTSTEAAPAESDTGRATTVIVEPDAQQPDVTVFIETLDKSNPGKLRWRVEPAERFDGLPSCLRADIDLGQDPTQTAQALFKKFAVLTRGKHRESLEGFGDELWGKAPGMFHEAYWALVARYGRRLTIQFICDEPHLPWELMRPSTADEKQVHAPLALHHSVARWIDRYRGDMRNSLPGGSLVSIAPKYANARYALPRAQDEHEDLIKTLGATRLGGSRAELLGLLGSDNPTPRVGVLHFAGHGVFAPDVATASSIKLENGETLTAAEVKRKEVQLGRACRTLVFFNACEVGATGSVFGEVGGWADAFLDRKFGGFIAPLWAVEEDDSAQVAAELLDRIYVRRAPIGMALREIREKYADKSPTYFSYLYYGDVTARLVK